MCQFVLSLFSFSQRDPRKSRLSAILQSTPKGADCTIQEKMDTAGGGGICHGDTDKHIRQQAQQMHRPWGRIWLACLGSSGEALWL